MRTTLKKNSVKWIALFVLTIFCAVLAVVSLPQNSAEAGSV
jgi:hypothetical protein